MIFFHKITPVQLVPENAIIKISGILHHMRSKLFACEDTVILNIALVRDTLSDDAVEIGDHQIAVMFCGGAHEQLCRIRCDPVIAVEKLQVSAASLADGEITAVRYAGIFFVDDCNAGICGGVSIADVTGAVCASVVD